MERIESQGASIPAIGFGTFELEPDDAHAMTQHALKTGYRHVDTAQIYANEEAVGAGISDAGVPRGDIHLTTKVWIDQFADGDLQRSVEASLKRLDTDYVDLLLLHWPNPDIPLAETINALNEVRQEGLTRHIGISNFTREWIDQAVSLSAAPLVTNQVEYHPFLNQQPVIDKLDEHSMALTAYCPLAQGRVFSDTTLRRIGEAHGKNGGQVALRWLLQQGAIVIPRSSKPEHVTDNLAIFDFELSDEDMRTVSALHEPDGRIIDPGIAPRWDKAA